MNYCLGTVQFGIDYGIQNNKRPSIEVINELLDIAFKNNVISFDTAAAYGNSELILGDYFGQNIENAKIAKVITKVSSNILDNVDSNRHYEVISNYILSSIRKLKLNKLYGFMFHDSTVVNYLNKMNVLLSVKDSGLVDKVGVSVYSPDEAVKAIEHNVDIIQVPYNLFDQRLDKIDFFKKAKNNNVEIYVRSSLLQGLALMDYDKLPKNVEFAKDYLIKFDDLCKKYNIDKLSAAVNYVSCNKYIDYIVFGTDNKFQLQQYLSIRDNILPKSFINEVKSLFSNVPEKLVNPTLWR